MSNYGTCHPGPDCSAPGTVPAYNIVSIHSIPVMIDSPDISPFSPIKQRPRTCSRRIVLPAKGRHHGLNVGAE
jgi:hypothetical protein